MVNLYIVGFKVIIKIFIDGERGLWYIVDWIMSYGINFVVWFYMCL